MLALGGMIYLVGADEEYLNFEHYDPITSQWTLLEEFVDEELKETLDSSSERPETYIVALSKGIFASRVNERVVLYHSGDSTSIFSYLTHRCWLYTCDSGTWTKQKPMPTPRQSPSVCLGDMYYTF